MVNLKNKNDIKKLRISGKILSQTLSILKKKTKEGIPLRELDKIARREIEEAGAIPAFLNYQPSGAASPFPASICASVNDIIVHGIPGDYILKEGDVLKIDAGVNYKGYITDSAFTLGIGKISFEADGLIKVTRKALVKAIKLCHLGYHIGDIGWTVEKTIKKAGFKVIRDLTGHGVGFNLHEPPNVPNFGNKGTGLALEPGMVLAIEPITSISSEHMKKAEDDSFVTADGSVSAQFEHTVVITEGNPEILTE